MDQEVHPSVVLMASLSFSMANPKQQGEKYEENNVAGQFAHNLRQSNPLLVTDEQEPGIYFSETLCPISCPSVELPTQLFSSLSAP